MSHTSGADRAYTDSSVDAIAAEAGTPGYCRVLAVDLKSASANTMSALDGGAGEQFVPTKLVVECKTASALNGDVALTVGVGAGATDILTATTLTSLATVGQKFIVDLAGLQPAIAGNDATLDCTITSADSGTSGTADVYLHGYFTS